MGISLTFADLDDAEIGLWDDHLAAWQAWCAIASQWRTAAVSGLGGGVLVWIGLDYGAARAGLELAGIAVTPALWADVQTIEAGAVEELNRGR